MRIKASDLLRDVRERLSDPAKWTSGEYARDAAGHERDPGDRLAASWCGQGAIYASGAALGMPTLRKVIRDDWTTGFDWAKPLLDALDAVSIRFRFESFIDANDRGGRGAVLAVIDSAIAELESGGPSSIPRSLECADRKPRFDKTGTRRGASASH